MSQPRPSQPVDPRDTAEKPDMTPMIDVVFLMIIFFLCIDFRVLEAKLPAFLPKDRGGSHAIVHLADQLVVRIEPVDRGTPVPEPDGGRYRLTGRQVRWRVGPRPVHSLDALSAELQRVAASPSARVPDPDTGELVLLDALVEPLAGSCYADVTAVTDRLYAAGFEDVHYAGGIR